MNVEVYTLNAFAKGDRGGKPAGVVLEDGLSDRYKCQENLMFLRLC